MCIESRAMVGHSKMRPRLDDVAKGLSCHELYHPWTPSCTGAMRDMGASAIAGSVKLFTPVYLAQLLVNWRKVNISYLKKEAQAYVRTMAFTTCMGAPFVTIGCILTRLTEHRECVAAFLPAFVGGFGIFLEQPHKRGFLVSSFTSLVLEYVIHQLEDCGVFRMSNMLAALLFMVSNGLLMYLLRCEYLFPHARPSKNIWFFYPPPVKRENTVIPESFREKENIVKSNPLICPHKGSCRKHILMVTSKYMLLGVSLQFLRKGIPQMRALRKIPYVLLNLLYDRHNMKFGVFLAAYIGIYNVVSCMLNYFTGHDSELHAIYAGTMAGLAYCFQPNLTFALSGFTTAIIMLARHLVRQEIVPYVPGLDGVLFAISYGILLHARAFETHLCPRLATSLISTASNGKCDLIVDVYKKRQESYARK